MQIRLSAWKMVFPSGKWLGLHDSGKAAGRNVSPALPLENGAVAPQREERKTTRVSINFVRQRTQPPGGDRKEAVLVFEYEYEYEYE